MKRLATLLLFFCILSGMNTIAFASSDVKIKVNGSLLSDAQAILKDGSTLLPVRSVSTALGGEVIWDNETKTASIDKDDTSVNITIGQKEITVNNKKQAISTPAQIVNGRTYVPLRALGEALECDITWVNETKTVEISQLDPSEYKAWYEVDDKGNLHLRTNINSDKWGGYYIRAFFIDGKDYDLGYNLGSGTIKYSFASQLAWHDIGTTYDRIDFYIFKGKNPTITWPDLINYNSNNYYKALSAVSDKLVCQFTLENNITIKESEIPLQIADYNISYDKAKQTETFRFSMTDGISPDGSYALSCKRRNHNGPRAQMNNLLRSGDTLTVTQDIYRFADPGETATFYVSYGIHSINPDGSITCYKTESNGIDYKTPLF